MVRNVLSFCGAGSRILNANLRRKSIPSLELQGIVWGLHYIFDVYTILAGDAVVLPINITGLFLFTDSTCCLFWIESHSHKFQKINAKSVFVKNKLEDVDDLCSTHKVTFAHTLGCENPVDLTAKPCSFKTLSNSNFITGLETRARSDEWEDHNNHQIVLLKTVPTNADNT